MASSQSSVGVIWEGSFFVYHSLALVNREMALGFAEDNRIDLGLIPYEPHQFGPEVDQRFPMLQKRLGYRPEKVDIHIRHKWPPDFGPTEGKFILIQPWEFGSLPVEWVKRIQREVAEAWVPSSYVRQVYIQSGINPASVFVIPNGVNPDIFHPNGARFTLPTTRGFKFLFVGGTIPRKGIDILLQAYTMEFTSKDDVSLVIKDFGTRSFYRGSTWGEKIEEVRRSPNAPEIIYYTDDIPERDMGRLYRACNCLVHPYRGEGFGLPIAEAMACGLPVIVTAFGACLDFCNDNISYLISAELKRANEKWLGNMETASYPYWAEPDIEHLRYLMRHVYENPHEARDVGARASKYIRREFTWKRAAALAIDRVMNLAGVPHADEQGEANIGRDGARDMERDAKSLFERGIKQYLSGHHDAAAKLLQKVLLWDPDLKVARYDLAAIYAEMGRYEAAFDHIIDYLKVNSSDGEAWSLLGSILVGLGDLFTARLAYNRAAKCGYNADTLNSLLAEVDTAVGRTQDIFGASWYRGQVAKLLDIR